MADPVHIRFAGYSPLHTSHSRAALRFGETMRARLGEEIKIDHFWNVLDFGYKAEDLLAMVECGLLTMCYFSTSYLAPRVPDLEILDLPFLFTGLEQAREALDGKLGEFLVQKTEAQTGYRVLGHWDNGFRHLSNRLRPVRTPADCAGLRIRLQPNPIHVKTFELLGARPVAVDLKTALSMIEAGEVDAQENPLANTLTYGVHHHHKHLTLTGHFFGARGLYVHKESFDSWPEAVRAAARDAARDAIQTQRALADAEEEKYRAELEESGVSILALDDEEREAFIQAVAPVVMDARKRLGAGLFALAGAS